MNIRNLNIKDASSDALRALAQDINVELQERDLAERIHSEYANEEVFEDALTHGLTPEDASNPEWASKYEEWLSERDRKISMRTTGA